jgi:hypothetical protein
VTVSTNAANPPRPVRISPFACLQSGQRLGFGIPVGARLYPFSVGEESRNAASRSGFSGCFAADRRLKPGFSPFVSEAALNDSPSSMATLMRVEFSRGLRPDSPRFVLMIEIPDGVAANLRARRVSLETRAYEVALETSQVDRSNKPEHHMGLISCTKGRVKNLASLGEPSLLAQDACRAWIIKRPSPLQELNQRRWQSKQ